MHITMKQYTATTVGILIILAILAGVAYYTVSGKADEKATREIVEGFGLQLKNVPLTAEAAAVQESIGDYYAPYVMQDLLTAWITNPEQAPGRATSSPWPDRIEITDIAEQGAGYVVTGNVILMTSVEVATEAEDNAGTVPVVLQLIPTDDGWRIVAYQEQVSQEE